jgi:peptidyl-prolyl cis-trans isomerase D
LWDQYRDENEKVKIDLTAIVPQKVVPDSMVPMSEAEINAYYKAHLNDFSRPATAYLSFVALPRLTTAADTAAARGRADSVRAEIVGGAPFADVARRESSDSVSAARGGDLGEWTRGSMDAAFDSAAFAMPLNTVSQPVRSAFGFHLIEMTSRKGNKAKGRHILIPIEVAGAHRDQLDAQADSLEKLGADKSDPAALDTVARALKLKVGRTMPVQEGGRVQVGNLVVPDAGVWAFTAKPGQTGPVVDADVAYYVFRLDSLKPSGVPPLADIRQSVASLARADKKLEPARKLAEDYAKRLKSGGSFEAVADSLKLPHKEFGPFSRVNPPLTDPIVIGAAFGTKQGETSGRLESKEGIYFLKVLERTKADSAAFAKDLDNYRARMINLARQERVRSYLEALRQAAKVVDDRKEVLRQQGAAPPPGA